MSGATGEMSREGAGARSRVAVVRCPDYDAPTVASAMDEAIGLLGGARAALPVRVGGHVLVKPNVLAPFPPERPIDTHPALVAAAVALARAAGAGRVSVGDSSGGAALTGRTARALAVSGIAGAARSAGADVVNFDAGGAREVAGRGGRRLYLAPAALDADAIINLPKLKTHGLTIITGAVKNLYGCVPGGRKTAYHREYPRSEDFAGLLVDIYGAVYLGRPALTVVDAVWALDGLGPGAGGNPRRVGLILAGTDGVAVDAVCALLAGLPPLRMPTCRLAAAAGLGVADPDRIDIVGLPLSEARPDRFVLPITTSFIKYAPAPVVRAAVTLLRARPVVEASRCTGCGTCAATCPSGAMRVEGGQAHIDLHRCLDCLCCQENCPEAAVLLRRRFALPRRSPRRSPRRAGRN